MRFSFPHSHAFQGGRLQIDDAETGEGTCMVAFGDGVEIIGEWQPDGDDILLDIPAYRTARGTDVSARSWRLAQGRDGRWRSRRHS